MWESRHPLFVYGTLRPGAKRHNLVRSFLEGGQIIPASLTGYQMYSFRSFPGIVAAINKVDKPVVGEAVYFSEENYREALAYIDLYEGNGYVFNRRLLMINLGTVEVLTQAWVYLVNPKVMAVRDENKVKSNDWFEYARTS